MIWSIVISYLSSSNKRCQILILSVSKKYETWVMMQENYLRKNLHQIFLLFFQESLK